MRIPRGSLFLRLALSNGSQRYQQIAIVVSQAQRVVDEALCPLLGGSLICHVLLLMILYNPGRIRSATVVTGGKLGRGEDGLVEERQPPHAFHQR